MILIITSDNRMLQKIISVLSKNGKEKEIERALSIDEAFSVIGTRTVDCFIVVEQRINSGVLQGVRFIDALRKNDIYRFTPVIYISDIPDHFGKLSNTYQLFAYLDRGFDPVSSEEIFVTAASYRTRRENLRLSLRVAGVTHLLRTDEIEYVRSEGHEMIICCNNSSQLYTRSFGNLLGVMRMLDSCDIVQCSRSSLCNVRYVKWVDRANMLLGMNSGEKLRIGKKYKKQLLESLSGVVRDR